MLYIIGRYAQLPVYLAINRSLGVGRKRNVEAITAARGISLNFITCSSKMR